MNSDERDAKLVEINGKIDYLMLKLATISRRLDDMAVSVGRIENRQVGNEEHSPEFKVYSQWGEDGIIQHIINNIKLSNNIFVEFGVENYTESNTRFLLKHSNWSGLVIDGSEENINYIKKDDIYWKYNIKAVHSFITRDNINRIIRENGIAGDIGLLSIDIDGNDFWVWNAIDVVTPDIVICEYNSRLGKEKSIAVEYDETFNRFEKHYSGIYFGASIKAFCKLAEEKGYALVDGCSNGANLFFVKKDLLNSVIHEKTIDEVYRKNQFNDDRNAKGELERLSDAQEQEIIESLKWVEV